jgi:hypothetical protein
MGYLFIVVGEAHADERERAMGFPIGVTSVLFISEASR